MLAFCLSFNLFLSMTAIAVVVGVPRSGTTLLASMLSNAGLNSGMADKDWDPAGGYYEHPILISCSGDIQKSARLAGYSDRLSDFFLKRAKKKLSRLPADITLAKFPNYSYSLPPLLASVGRNPVCVVAIRRFDFCAISRYKLNPALSYDDLKSVYLKTYRQCLLLASLFKVVFVPYEDIVSGVEISGFPEIEYRFGLTRGAIASSREELVRSPRQDHLMNISDSECNYLYDKIYSFVH